MFYGGLKDVHSATDLVYAIIGFYVVDEIVRAASVQRSRWHENAHTRRIAPGADDIVVRARQGVSGRLGRCLPIGEWRRNAYRVRLPLLKAWNGLGVKDGYLQRSARLPELLDASRFYDWFHAQEVRLLRRNN